MLIDKKLGDIVKKEWRYKKDNFLRKHYVLQNLIKARVQGNMLWEAHKALAQAYEALDASNVSYVKLASKTMMECEGDCLRGPCHLYYKAQAAYYQICGEVENARAMRGFEAAKRKATTGIQALKDSCTILTKLSLEGSMSFADTRLELAKIEA